MGFVAAVAATVMATAAVLVVVVMVMFWFHRSMVALVAYLISAGVGLDDSDKQIALMPDQTEEIEEIPPEEEEPEEEETEEEPILQDTEIDEETDDTNEDFESTEGDPDMFADSPFDDKAFNNVIGIGGGADRANSRQPATERDGRVLRINRLVQAFGPESVSAVRTRSIRQTAVSASCGLSS